MKVSDEHSCLTCGEQNDSGEYVFTEMYRMRVRY